MITPLMLPTVHIRYTVAKYLSPFMEGVGCGFLRNDYHTTFRTVFCWVMTLGSLFSMLFTVVTADQDTALKCSTLVAVTLQGCLKFLTVIVSAHKLCAVYNELLRVMEQCERHSAPQETAALRAWQPTIDFVMPLFVIVILGNMIVFILTPVANYLLTGIMELPLPILIPFVDGDTAFGFGVSIAMQFIAIGIAAMGTIGYDLLMLLMFMNVCMLTDVMLVKLKLQEDGLAAGGPELAERSETSAYLDNFVRIHWEYNETLAELNSLYYISFFSEISLNSLAMCLILFVMTLLVWFPLYVFFMMFLMKAFEVCLIGTMVDIYTERLYSGFEALSWYKLAMRDRFKYLLILQQMQRPMTLKCATTKLNMELFVAVMKNTYTVAMMLNEMSN